MSDQWYVYAIVRDDESLAGLSAPGDRTLTLVPWRHLAAVTEMVTAEPSRCDVDAILRHNDVVEGLHRERATLPVRFGAVFHDAPAVARSIADRYSILLADLERVGRKIEVGLTVLWETPAGASTVLELVRPHHGGRYLRARAAELRREEKMKERATAIAAELTRHLSDEAIEHRVRLLPTRDIALRTACLMNRSDLERFHDCVERAGASLGEVRLVIGGACPPYSFVSRNDPRGDVANHGQGAQFAAALTALTSRMPGLNGPGAERVN
jgi:hypothetical protein